MSSARHEASAQPRGSIAGTVTDDTGVPIARAQVCAGATGLRLPSAITRAPRCAFTDDRGRYRIGGLIASEYLVRASARLFKTSAFHPQAGADNQAFPLAAGEDRTGVDVELKRGGAEITGVVFDISGGPVAHAEVREATQEAAHAGATVDTDEQGRFALWIDRGEATLEASAEGYVPAQRSGRAPGKVEIFLIPESSLDGTVVDAATDQPVAGAQVELEVSRADEEVEERDITDGQGRFHLGRLAPGRYTVGARTAHGYGRSATPLPVGLGQHRVGTVIKLFPAHRISGKVVIASSREDCPAAQVTLVDRFHDRRLPLGSEPGGQRVAEGILSGTYAVSIRCSGYAARDDYDPIIVGDRDVNGLVWAVDEGARIRGRVVTRPDAALEGVALRSQSVDLRAESGWGFARSKADGSFELAGLVPGRHQIIATSDRAVAPQSGFEVTVAPAATVERDLVLDATGQLTGSVVDDTGEPVANAQILLLDGPAYTGEQVRSDADGAFGVDALLSGNYRVIACRDTVSPGDIPTTVTVRTGQTATVKLITASQRGAITGVVVDASNHPVSDAFLSWAPEHDGLNAPPSIGGKRYGWHGDVRPVLSATDGTFQLTGLANKTYTVRAERKGGDEAIAQHVAVGSRLTLRIKRSGSIAGTARQQGAPPLRDLRVILEDTGTGLKRGAWFYMTGGQFTLTDLPAGHLDIVVEGNGGHAATAVDLQDGEARTGVDVELTPQVTVTGRLVEHGTQKPVPRYQMAAMPAQGAGAREAVVLGEDPEAVTDEAGRFVLHHVPLGLVQLQGVPRDSSSNETVWLSITRAISGSGTVDVGDVGLIKSRLKEGDRQGVLGFQFESPRGDAPTEQRAYKISAIDAAGPAAASGLQVGDFIIMCDGVDVVDRNLPNWWTLIDAPPGTKLTIRTRRGFTATVVLAAPPPFRSP